jgi:hypothetical protein
MAGVGSRHSGGCLGRAEEPRVLTCPLSLPEGTFGPGARGVPEPRLVVCPGNGRTGPAGNGSRRMYEM